MRLMLGDRLLASDIEVARTFASRLKGLIGRDALPRSHALLLTRCNSVHTCFMRFEILVIYLDASYAALDAELLAPWRFGRKVKGVRHVIELSSDACPLDELDVTQIRLDLHP